GTGNLKDTVSLGIINVPAGNNVLETWLSITGDVNTDNDTLMANLTPADFTLSTATDTVCIGSGAIIDLDPSEGYVEGQITWESSPDASTYTCISNSDTITYVTPGLTSNTFYRTFINSGVGGCYSDTMEISVNNPSDLVTLPDSICGPGVATVGVVPGTGVDVEWFDAPVGGTSLGVGNTYVTPFISTTTTYYAQGSNGGGMGNAGPLNPSAVGTTGSGTSAPITTYHVSFDVLAPTTLLSVDVFPTASINSSASIVIQDNANNTLITVPYVTTVTGGSTPQTIPINLALAPGSGYKIGQGTNISLYRNTSGAS